MDATTQKRGRLLLTIIVCKRLATPRDLRGLPVHGHFCMANVNNPELKATVQYIVS
jgi:hypothetical protein